MTKKNFFKTAVAVIALSVALPALADTVGGKNLVNTGTGSRTKFGMDMYKATLAVPAEMKGAQANQIIDADQPMMITLKITSSMISRDKFVSAVSDALDAAAKAGYQTADKKAYIDLFSAITIVKGDVFAHQFVPGKGMAITYTTGGKTQVLGTVKNIQFKKAFFAMFIGPKPIQNSMKNEMLGK
ncbi:MAG: chalcone isomerase family protein [Spirochaetota bacterium]